MAEEKPKVNGFLGETIARKRAEVARRRARTPVSELRARSRARPPGRPWAERLRRGEGEPLRVIAEFKRASPSAGSFDGEGDPAERARIYAAAGATAMSVLTDAAFDGTLADLEAAAGAGVDLALLRKDFLVDPWQVWESRAYGADAVLLLAAALDAGELAAVAAEARRAGLGLLVEIHDPEETDRALSVEPDVIGVNARDLSTLEVSVPGMLRTVEMLRARAGDAVLVAESGITGPAAARRALEAGADAILVGELLMRSVDPRSTLAELTAVGAPEKASP